MVTSLSAEKIPAQILYEQIYCTRGEMENRIKEQHLDLFADRTFSHTFRANQFRLSLTAFAYVLIETLLRTGVDREAQDRLGRIPWDYAKGRLRLTDALSLARFGTVLRRVNPTPATPSTLTRTVFRIAPNTAS